MQQRTEKIYGSTPLSSTNWSINCGGDNFIPSPAPTPALTPFLALVPAQFLDPETLPKWTFNSCASWPTLNTYWIPRLLKIRVRCVLQITQTQEQQNPRDKGTVEFCVVEPSGLVEMLQVFGWSGYRLYWCCGTTTDRGGGDGGFWVRTSTNLL